MKEKNGLYLLMLRIASDGDFYWKLKSFPEEQINGHRMDEVLIYLKDPTADDIRNIMNQVAKEFKNSFNCSRSYLIDTDIEGKYVRAFTSEDNISRLLNYGEFYEDYGNQSLDVKLIPYVTKSIKIHNTGEVEEIGQFDVKYYNLL
jgi:hypothetical protein